MSSSMHACVHQLQVTGELYALCSKGQHAISCIAIGEQSKCTYYIGYIMYIKWCARAKCQHDMKRVFGGFAVPSHLVMMSRVGGRDVSLASAARRVSQLHRALSWRPLSASCRLCSSTLGGAGGEKGGEEGRSLLLVTS